MLSLPSHSDFLNTGGMNKCLLLNFKATDMPVKSYVIILCKQFQSGGSVVLSSYYSANGLVGRLVSV
jgi:hypothetical protein